MNERTITITLSEDAARENLHILERDVDFHEGATLAEVIRTALDVPPTVRCPARAAGCDQGGAGMSAPMTRDDVERVVSEALRAGAAPDLSGADLHWADLHWADLRGANLSGANLSWANLSEVDLRGANLSGADLRWANLRWANLSWANLSGANMSWADLRRAHGGILQITGAHPYQAILTPQVGGWHLRIGCWSGTTDDLRALVATDDDWPEATGEQCAQRRPSLLAIADLCDAHAATHTDDLAAVQERWGTGAEETTHG